MTPANYYNQYRQMEVSTSSDPKKLVLMLYDGCLKFLTIAEKAMEKKEIEKKAIHIGKALEIISELNSCLDRRLDDEIVPFLEAMYTHMMHKLLEANLTNDPKIVQHVYRLVENLRKNWLETAMSEEKTAGSEKPKMPVMEEVAPQPRPATGTYGMMASNGNTARKTPLSFVI
ncbi:MAG: flagellar export chaperone FliS [Deltaproteobacteria bacterium]|nr:flagellar export chaperone FliS [Deltaproteobacteria bacterium]